MELGILVFTASTALLTAVAALASWATVQQMKQATLPSLAVNYGLKGGRPFLNITNGGGGLAAFAEFVVVCPTAYEHGLAKGFLKPGETALVMLAIPQGIGPPEGVAAMCRDTTGSNTCGRSTEITRRSVLASCVASRV